MIGDVKPSDRRLAGFQIEGLPTAILKLIEFDSVTNSFKFVAPGGGADFDIFGEVFTQATGSNRFANITCGSKGAVEANSQNVVGKARTAKSLKVNIITNSAAANMEFVLRVNGSDTALIIDIPNGTTGIFTIAADVALSVDDLINYRAEAVAGSVDILPVLNFE